MLRLKSFVFSPIQENTYLLYNEMGDCIIIDPGCYFREEEAELDQFISDNQLKPRLLLNTHCHLDHVFGNKYVAEKYGLIPHIHPKEKQLLDYAPTSGLIYNMPFDNYTGTLAYITPGEPIKLGADELMPLFTPGHSPGSISFHCAQQQFIVSGDVLFYHSIGRTDLPGGNLETLLESIRKELFSLPDETVVHSGHGPQTSIGEERRNNPFLQ